jgi:hypothetical protein
MYRRKIIPLAIGLLLASLVVVNAAVFAYRWMNVSITVNPPTEAKGAACTGFYSSSAQPGISPTYLPSAGTNYNAQTYGSNTITVKPGNIVCQWSTYYLYDSITVSMTVTNGSWYIRDLYGFGYYGSTTDPTVYVWIRVEQPVTGVNYAYLQVYNATDKSLVEIIDLTKQNTYGYYAMSPGKAFQLDLNISIANTGTYSFKVGFYVSQQSAEAPR